MQCCTAVEGCQCTRDRKRTWVKPYFGIRLGKKWFFPIGTGMVINRADKIRNDIGYVIWALGITGWIKAARDVTRGGNRSTVKRDTDQGEPGGIM